MEFETLIAKLRRVKAEFGVNLARCHDVYRLAHLVNIHMNELGVIRAEADKLVQELERSQDGGSI